MPDTMNTFCYAMVLFDGHLAVDAPKFSYKIVSATGVTIDSIYYDAVLAAQPGSGFFAANSAVVGLYYRPWHSHATALKNYVGQTITVQFYSSDCDGGAHRGYAYIDCYVGPTVLVGVTNYKNESSFNVYPNPNNGLLNV